ncbi:hypothetical protein [Sporosarcina sp. YIM B06819]|uniref:hypothetical protein n=1 Tax=Sporosarcina sp. YIM B06819 TaxID=3081769 RepID=UPI00298CE8D9|nr:hypothetical protein [Sporosarcina sp. YIM B06819]
MKGKRIISVLSVTGALLLAGCGSTPEEDTASHEEESTETVASQQTDEELNAFLTATFLGDWYPNVGLTTGDDIKSYIAYRLKLEEVDENNRVLGTVQSFVYDESTNTEKSITFYWDAEKEVLVPENNEDIESFSVEIQNEGLLDEYHRGFLAFPNSNRLLAMADYTDLEDALENRMGITQQTFKNERRDSGEITTNAETEDSAVPDFVFGSWKGFIPSSMNRYADNMRFELTFKSVNGSKVEGTYTEIENGVPIDYNFKGTYNPETSVILIDSGKPMKMPFAVDSPTLSYLINDLGEIAFSKN